MNGRKQGDLFGVRIDPEIVREVRAAVTNLRGAPEFLTYRDFVERAFRRELSRLGKRNGVAIFETAKARRSP